MTTRLMPPSWGMSPMASMTRTPRFPPHRRSCRPPRVAHSETSEVVRGGSVRTMSAIPLEITISKGPLVDVRIGVTQAPREISIEVADDVDRDDVKSKIEAALAGAVDVLW